MIDSEGFVLEKYDRENGEHCKRYGFLYDFQLPKVVWTAIFDVADPVGWNHETVFKGCHRPTEDDDQRQRELAKPGITLKFEIAVPSKEHEYV